MYNVWPKARITRSMSSGSKVSIARTKRSGILLGALNIEKNQYDSNTLPVALRQIEELKGNRLKVAITDQGYRGRRNHGETVIVNAARPA